jgi:hypothetical protein
MTPTTNTIDRELTEAKLDNERRDELRDSELDTVIGGSFQIGNILGSVAKAVIPVV